MVSTTFPDELIGEEITIVDSTNKDEIGITGIVIDETKNTLLLDVQGKRKTIIKHTVTLKVIRTGQVVAGKNIVKRPEDRIKGKER